MYSDLSVVQPVATLSNDCAIAAPSGRRGEGKVPNSTNTCTLISMSFSQEPFSLLTAISRLHMDVVEKGKFLNL
jgi:hypothetical protein